MHRSIDQRSRVIILDNDQEMLDLLSLQLSQACEVVRGVQSVKEALTFIGETHFDLLIMNWNMPDIAGIDLIKEIRKLKPSGKLSVLILSNSLNDSELVRALDAGVNDFLVKPFDRSELLSRVKTLVRRVCEAPEPTVSSDRRMNLGEVEIDTKSFDVFCKSERIHLTPSEFKLLHALAMNRGVVLTRDHLITLVQGEGIAVIDRAVDTHIFGLRKKLGEYGNSIETVRGVGYRVL